MVVNVELDLLVHDIPIDRLISRFGKLPIRAFSLY